MSELWLKLINNPGFLGALGAFIYEFIGVYREKEKFVKKTVNAWNSPDGKICTLICSVLCLVYILIGAFVTSAVVSEIPSKYPFRLFSIATGLSLDLVIRSLMYIGKNFYTKHFPAEKTDGEKEVKETVEKWERESEPFKIFNEQIRENRFRSVLYESAFSKLVNFKILLKCSSDPVSYVFDETIKDKKQLIGSLNEIGINDNTIIRLFVTEWQLSQLGGAKYA